MKRSKAVNNNSLDLQEWEQLLVPDKILQAIDELGFKSPTSIQCLTLPVAIRDRMNILGASETGSGKTLAFGIPMIARILEEKDKLFNNIEYSLENKPEDHDFEAIEKLMDDVDDDGEADQPPDEEEVLHTWKDGDIKPDLTLLIEEVYPDSNQNPHVPLQDSKMTVSAEQSVDNNLYGLVITPTRELAIQVADHITKIAKYTDITVGLVFGGMSQEKQRRLLRKCPQIVVATPGRLWEFIEQGEPHLSKVGQLKALVIDEADRLFESGHFAELKLLLEWINTRSNKKSARDRQIFVFSATLTFVHRGAQIFEKKGKKKAAITLTKEKKLADFMTILGLSKNTKVIDVTQSVEKLSEMKVHCSLEDKDLFLWYFLRSHSGRTLIFCNSKSGVRRLASILSLLEYKPLVLHADMHQKHRLKSLDKFVGDPCSVLLASDVAARGLDIPHVHHVIHFDVPRTAELYLHRSGRTARASRSGLSLLLLQPSDLKLWRKICLSLKKQDKDIPHLEEDLPLLNSLRPAVALARYVDENENSISKIKSRKDWFSRMAQEADLELDDELIDEEELDHHGRNQQDNLKRELKQKRIELNHLISRLNNSNPQKSGAQSSKNIKFSLKKETQSNVSNVKSNSKSAAGKVIKNSDLILPVVEIDDCYSEEHFLLTKKSKKEVEAELKQKCLNELISPRYPALGTTLNLLQNNSSLGLKSKKRFKKLALKKHNL